LSDWGVMSGRITEVEYGRKVNGDGTPVIGKARDLLREDGADHSGGSAPRPAGTRRLSAITLVLATPLLICMGCGDGSVSGAEPGAAPQGAQDAPLIEAFPAEFTSDDLAFVTDATALFRSSQELSELVPSRSSDEAVTGFAQQRIQTAQPQMGVAQALSIQSRNDSGPTDALVQAQVEGVASPDTVGRLSTLSGRDFDLAWMDAASSLHAIALESANSELAQGKNADALGLARQMAQTEQAAVDEIKQERVRIGAG